MTSTNETTTSSQSADPVIPTMTTSHNDELIQWTDHNWKTFKKACGRCQLSHLYHQKRAEFLTTFDNACTGISLIAGASFLLDVEEIFPDGFKYFKVLLGGLVVLMSSIQLVCALKDKAVLHTRLAQDFKKLEANAVGSGVMNANQLDDFQAKLLLLEVDEPPLIDDLVLVCQDILDNAKNPKDKQVQSVAWIRRKLLWF